MMLENKRNFCILTNIYKIFIPTVMLLLCVWLSDPFENGFLKNWAKLMFLILNVKLKEAICQGRNQWNPEIRQKEIPDSLVRVDPIKGRNKSRNFNSILLNRTKLNFKSTCSTRRRSRDLTLLERRQGRSEE